MITNFKIFEKNDSDEIEVYLDDIYYQSPWYEKKMNNKYNLNVKKDYSFIINKLEELFLHKYVNFEHYEYNNLKKEYVTILLNGVVEEVMYDNEWGDRSVYFKLKNSFTFYSVNKKKPVLIDLARSDAEKYNL